MSLAFLLHAVQHVAFGYSAYQVISEESFLAGVRSASSARRILVLMGCGFIAGFGWWALYRYGKPLVSVRRAVHAKRAHMPLLSTCVHVILQIVTIALGSPLGREVAPRELSALMGGMLSRRAGFNLQDTQVMIACGAGAGLAAVYNVPLGGAFFTLEVLLCTRHWSLLWPAFMTSLIATGISWIGLGNVPQYHIVQSPVSPSLIIWALLTGPLFGLAAVLFTRITAHATRLATHHTWLPLGCILNFTIIGVLAVYFPSLLGNGKSPAQIEFDDASSILLAATLLILRTGITWSSLRAGARGGLLTPSLANGALLAVVLGGGWNYLWPGTHLSAFAVIGAAAFLAAAQNMPLTAIVLLFEFTRIPLSFFMPISVCVGGSMGMYRLLRYRA